MTDDERKAEMPAASFADMAIRCLHSVGREAQSAARRQDATARSVVSAIMKILPVYMGELRAAIHRAPFHGAGPIGLGLRFPTPDEAMVQNMTADPAVKDDDKKES